MIVLLLRYKTNKVSYLVGHFPSSLYFLHAMWSHFLKHLVKMDNWPEWFENGRCMSDHYLWLYALQGASINE